ncbi:MAG: hypothetical protein ABDH19_01695 [Thermodesulfovibrio sp.]
MGIVFHLFALLYSTSDGIIQFSEIIIKADAVVLVTSVFPAIVLGI